MPLRCMCVWGGGGGGGGSVWGCVCCVHKRTSSNNFFFCFHLDRICFNQSKVKTKNKVTSCCNHDSISASTKFKTTISA